jgi:hypothetical protein
VAVHHQHHPHHLLYLKHLVHQMWVRVKQRKTVIVVVVQQPLVQVVEVPSSPVHVVYKTVQRLQLRHC